MAVEDVSEVEVVSTLTGMVFMEVLSVAITGPQCC